jgi:hypothetical protein
MINLIGLITAVNPSSIRRTEKQWYPLLQEWEFDINTKSYSKGTTFSFRVTVSDATSIDFRFKLK